MVVVTANSLPPAVRGRMKLWFIEPRPNVFVSGIKDSVASKVVEYLYAHCPPESGLMIFYRSNEPPGFKVIGIGETTKYLTDISGLQGVVDNDASTSCSLQQAQHIVASKDS